MSRRHSIQFMSPRAEQAPAGRSRRSLGGQMGSRVQQLTEMAAAMERVSAASDMENDDERERRRRHQNRAVDRSADAYDSPLPPDRQDSVRRALAPTVTGMTNAQIAAEMEKCIKMNNENKISAKNAFGLKLIDCLDEVAKGNDPGHPNYVVAGTSIEASSKIYAYRVDVVHQAANAVAGGLMRGDKRKQGETESDDEGPQQEDMEEQGEVRKKKKKGAKGKTIEKLEKNITLQKLDVQFEFDPLYRRIMHKVSEEGQAFHMLSDDIALPDDQLRLQLHSYDLEKKDWQPAVQVSRKSVGADGLEKLMDILRGIDITPEDSVCPSLSTFEFGRDVTGDMATSDTESQPCASTSPAPDLLLTPPHQPVGFGLDLEADDDYCGEAPLDVDSDHDNDEIVIGAAGHAAGRGGEALIRVKDEGDAYDDLHDRIAKAISAKPLEYNFFSPDAAVLQTWRGPDHWKAKLDKAKAQREKLADPEQLQRDLEQKRAKRSKKRKVESLSLIDLLDAPAPINKPGLERCTESSLAEMESRDPDFTAIPAPSRAMTTLSREVLEKHTSQSTTLTASLRYKSENLRQLYLIPGLQVRRDSAEALELEPDNANMYDWDNVADPIDFLGGDDDDSVEMGGFAGDAYDEPGPSTAILEEPLLGEPLDSQGSGPSDLNSSLIAEPLQVRRQDIKYTKRAKRVDVRRLKNAMWRELTREALTASKEIPISPRTGLPTKMAGEVPFTRLYDTVVQSVGGTTQQNLSAPIAFVCFLHMCNEQNLSLEQQEDMKDFIIRQD